MIALLDTNILLRDVDATDPQHSLVSEEVRGLLDAGWQLMLAPQCLYEFWVVATRPKAENGLGIDATEAARKAERLQALYELQPDPSDLVARWLSLCIRHAIAGKPSHDARLVAWMGAYGVTRIVTLNPSDFRKFGDIEMIVPGEARWSDPSGG